MKEMASTLQCKLVEAEVTNLVATCHFGNALKLGDTWDRLRRESVVTGYYEPELFTAITLSKPYHCKIFATGKLYVTGIRDKNTVNLALSDICTLLNKCGVK